MPTTSNFGWTTPADTDLVKDGALAIRTLGNGIDTSFLDLKGGTTGQILSKASNTDLDYTWINNDQGDITAVTAGTGISGGGTSGAVTITNSMATTIDAKGDLIVGTADDTFARLAVGSNNQVLTADSSTATGLKWASAGGGGKVLQVVSTIKTDTFSQSSTSTLTDVTGLSVTITPTANTSKIFIIAHIGVSDVSAGSGLGFALVRGSTKIGAGDTAGSRNTVIAGGLYDPERANPVAFSYLDSPATTSSTTYKIQMYNNNATGYVNRTHTDSDSAAYPRGSSTITVWEIGA